MVNRLHRVLRQFSSGLVHELSNYMNGLSLGHQLLEQQVDNPDVRSSLEQLDQLQEQMGQLKERLLLLDLPKEERRSSLDLCDVVDRFRSSTTSSRDHAPVKVRIPANQSIRIRADERAIHQVLTELVDNASRFGCAETIRIDLSTEETSAVMAVVDDGPGFPDDPPDNPFDPFVTSDDRSLGLGLTIAEQIVTGHEGTLEITSEKAPTAVAASFPRQTNDRANA